MIFFSIHESWKQKFANTTIIKAKGYVTLFQIAAMRNKQDSGTKTVIELFLINSGASVICINIWGICSTYQTLYNKLEAIVNNHQLSVQKYIHRQVNLYRWLS